MPLSAAASLFTPTKTPSPVECPANGLPSPLRNRVCGFRPWRNSHRSTGASRFTSAATASNSTSTAAAGSVQVQRDESPIASLPNWDHFASRVSGEWDGYGAEFTSDGKPVELPENVVPDAFREWEVKVFDWQTQCPTLAETGKPILTYKLIKLLPTVGCEADAATRHSVKERTVGGVNNKGFSFAYDSGGNYVTVWSLKEGEEGRIFEIEHCLVDPRDHETRMRLIQVVCIGTSVSELLKIKVFSENWYGPFRNGEQLGGCAIRESGFATTSALEASDVVGTWKSSRVSANFQSLQTDIINELVDDKSQKIIRDGGGLVTLPKQLWCSLERGEDGETHGEVGWLLDRGNAITSTCSFSKDGCLKVIAMGQETTIV